MRRLLLASFLGIVLVALAISSVPFAFFIQTVERERLLTTLERDAFVIAGKAEEALESLSPSDLRPVRDLAQEYRDAGGARVVVTDEQGIVVVTNDPEENRAGVSYLSRPEFAEATAGQISTGERYSETLGLTLVYVAVPVFSGQNIVGAVRLTFDKDVIYAEVSRQLTGILIVALTTLALGGALALILSRTLARGIRELEHASEAFAGGDFSARAREDVGPSDIRALAGGFNAMAEKVSALVETQRRFASDASHQLRTPLTALMLRIEGLRESVKPTAKVTERFDALEQEIARLNRLIDGLLALGRAGAEKTPVISVDASTLARERVESWRRLADESGVTVDSHIEDNVTITAAETALEHILDVYIDNALAVSPAGSTITVLLTREGSAITLLVQDEGPGVSDEVARRAFDRFWRGGSSYEGSGLGLAIVKELADASGARVALESRENGGAQARVVFQT
ncbi:MAG: ATP-binding protein [Pontimonas sp.]